MNTLLNVVKALRAEVDAAGSEDISATQQLAIATTISANLKVPAVPESDDGATEYNTKFSKEVRGLVSEINEHFYIDVTAVTDLVKNMYIARFNIVHNPAKCVNILTTVANCVISDTSLAGVTMSDSEFNKMNLVVGAYVREATAETPSV